MASFDDKELKAKI